jgi:AcrR family transcriptional regulator
MARPQGITDEEVLAAARAVLLGKGVSATVEEVAERCHVGVATIFRRFPTKQALFTAAMNVSNDAEWGRFLAKRAEAFEQGDARAALIELAHAMLDAARKMLPLFMMKMANPSLTDKEAGASRALWILKSLADYFKLEIEAGRMVEADPRVLARVWLGTIRHIVIFETLGPSVDDLSSDALIEGLADMFCVPPPGKKRNK